MSTAIVLENAQALVDHKPKPVVVVVFFSKLLVIDSGVMMGAGSYADTARPDGKLVMLVFLPSLFHDSSYLSSTYRSQTRWCSSQCKDLSVWLLLSVLNMVVLAWWHGEDKLVI